MPVRLGSILAPYAQKFASRYGINIAVAAVALEGLEMLWHWGKQNQFGDRFEKLEKRVNQLEQKSYFPAESAK